jgi:hypothetical protein
LKLGLELIARKPLAIRLGTFFETWIALPAGTVRRSLGRDEYHLDLTIGSRRRVAATGRTHTCQLDLELAEIGTNQAGTALPAAADIVPGTPVLWGIRTNQFLSLPALLDGATAVLVREGAEPLPFALTHPHLATEEVAPGRYTVDVSALLLN